MSDLDQTLSSECLDAKQSLILADIKLKRLESYIGNVSPQKNPLLPSFTVVSKESEELKVKLKESQSETRYLKSQLEYLEGELKAMAMAQNRQIGQQAEGESRENMLHMERKIYRECCTKMADMYRQVLTIIGDGQSASGEVDIMNKFVELTAEKVKLIKGRQLLV